MVEVCKCCGHPIASDEIAAVLPGKQRRLYEIVRDAGQLGVSCGTVMDRLYADDINGGPESHNVVQVQAMHVNRKLRAFGIAVRGRGGPGSVYRLVKL